MKRKFDSSYRDQVSECGVMVAASDLKSEVVMACRFESGHSYQYQSRLTKNTKVDLSGVSIMDNTGDFYSLDSSSILLRRTKILPARLYKNSCQEENTATSACPGGMSVTKQLGQSPYGQARIYASETG